MKKMFKKIIFIVGIICALALFTGAIAYNYNNDTNTESYTLYSIDGKTMIAKSEKERDAQLTVGWSLEKPITVYNTNNETATIFVEDLDEYLAAGWYKEPVTKLYAEDGREEYFVNSMVEAQLTVGWYRTYEEAHPVKVNYDDVYLLARLINGEAARNNTLDKQYVGAVVMNRLRMGLWGSTLRSVIYAKGQYACTWNGSRGFNSTPPQDCIDIATALLRGETYGVPSNVIYQAQFKQGSGVWKKVGVHYYCYR